MSASEPRPLPLSPCLIPLVADVLYQYAGLLDKIPGFEAAVSSSYLASLSFYTPPPILKQGSTWTRSFPSHKTELKTQHLKRDKAALFLERCGRRQLQAIRWFSISRQVAGLHNLLSFGEKLRKAAPGGVPDLFGQVPQASACFHWGKESSWPVLWAHSHMFWVIAQAVDEFSHWQILVAYPVHSHE